MCRCYTTMRLNLATTPRSESPCVTSTGRIQPSHRSMSTINGLSSHLSTRVMSPAAAYCMKLWDDRYRAQEHGLHKLAAIFDKARWEMQGTHLVLADPSPMSPSEISWTGTCTDRAGGEHHEQPAASPNDSAACAVKTRLPTHVRA